MAIALIACSKIKSDDIKRGKAYEIYDGDIFNKSYEWMKDEVGAENIYILSAKYHVLRPNDIIERYNKYLADYSEDYHKTWADQVKKKLREEGVLDENGICREKCYMLAGEDYIKYIRDCFPNRIEPFHGKRMGKILHYLDNKTPKNESMKSLKDYIIEMYK